MKKEFLPYDVVRNNALKLAQTIFNDGFIPNVIYVSLRGGAYIGNVISEYFNLCYKSERPIYYAAVVARSYTTAGKAGRIIIEGWTYPPEHLEKGNKVLLVDDIFDSGNTINHLADIILSKGILRKDLKIAVHDYKFFHDKANQPLIRPDYWCRKHVLSNTDEKKWIHYMSHELVGLTPQELEGYYYSQEPSLRGVFS